MFNLVENAVEFITNIDYQVIAIKVVEVGFKIVKWGLQ